MFKIVASIMNMGNMKFKQKPRDEQAEVLDPAGTYNVSITSNSHIQYIE